MAGTVQTPSPHPAPGNFRKFFLRGVAILLPSVLTIWLLIAAYQFVQSYIAQPINSGVRQLILRTTPWPRVSPAQAVEAELSVRELRRQVLTDWWGQYALGLDLIGLIIAIVLIYGAGLLVGSFIGRRLYHYGEGLVHRLPLVGRVYPAVKQVTDFFLGDHPQRTAFNRVVAVEYPRKGIWSVGMVTGATMRGIHERLGQESLTIFVPSSPTPFTGYVITVPKSDTIDLPITIEDALKFAVSGGVLIPPNQVIPVEGAEASLHESAEVSRPGAPESESA